MSVIKLVLLTNYLISTGKQHANEVICILKYQVCGYIYKMVSRYCILAYGTMIKLYQLRHMINKKCT